MIILAGLGNPGKKYQATRHNLGRDVLSDWQVKHTVDFGEFALRKNLKTEIAEGHLYGEKIILARLDTFMNLSGESILLTKNYYGANLEDIWIIHDDLDLPPGRLKISRGSSAGGHNGVKSIIGILGGKNFVRFRIGIGHPDKQSVDTYVLEPPKADEKPLINIARDNILKALDVAIERGLIQAQNTFNT